MPLYSSLRIRQEDLPEIRAWKQRTAEKLLALGRSLDAHIEDAAGAAGTGPVCRRDGRQWLRLGTWNIRAFGSSGYGGRLPEAMHCIAEIISRFDIVALQEVRENLQALRYLIGLLGSHEWDYIATDVTEGSSGNRERMVFVYRKNRVRFTGIAGEVVLDTERDAGALQFARSPFLVTFQAGWLKFILCTVHIYYGSGREGLARRNAEISKLTGFLARRAKNEHDSDAENLFFVLGDFNIVCRNHVTWRSLHSNGFMVPEQLRKIPSGSNVARDKAYDQIAFWQPESAGKPGIPFVDVGNAGIFDYYRQVFRAGDDDPGGEDERYYAEKAAEHRISYREWRTWQMSDHLPMWIELRTDFGNDYLSALSVPS